jgi:chromosome segregation ATPase
MDPQASAALVTAIAALIGTMATAFIGLRRLRMEKKKFEAEREKFRLEAEHMQSEIAKLDLETNRLRAEMEDIEHAQLELKRTESEIAKLRAETAKIRAALDEDKQRRLEESRLLLQEESRRRQHVYDLQAQAFRGLLAHIYRIRNAVRELVQLDEIWKRKGEVVTAEEVQERIMHHYDELREALFAERGVLPEQFFRLAHDVEGLVYRWDTYEATGKESIDLVGRPETQQLNDEINQRYMAMVEFVREHFGIDHRVP